MQHDWFMYHLRSTYKNRLDFPFNDDDDDDDNNNTNDDDNNIKKIYIYIIIIILKKYYNNDYNNNSATLHPYRWIEIPAYLQPCLIICDDGR